MESSISSKFPAPRQRFGQKYKLFKLLLCLFIALLIFGVLQTGNVQAATYTSQPLNPHAHDRDLKFQSLPHISKPLPTFSNGIKPLTAPDGTSVVLIHGINGGDGLSGSAAYGDNTMPGCETYWSDVRNFLAGRWQGDVRQLTYYTREVKSNGQGCTNNGNETRHYANLRVSEYASHCTNVGGGDTNAGTNNENIDHISCELAWYLYYNFGQYGKYEVLVGHSMGGLIIRRTLQLVRDHAADFPRNIGYVSDAITFNTPQEGELLGTFSCGQCYQGQQLTSGSAILTDMYNHGQAPSISNIVTDWTFVGSYCDFFVGADAVKTKANHKVLYGDQQGDISDGCYDHGSALHDTSTLANVYTEYCDTTDINDGTCDYEDHKDPGIGWSLSDQNSPHSLMELYYAIKVYNW